MKKIAELDAVALTCDKPAHGLMRGDVGAVVMVHNCGEAFEVEFVGYDGHTEAVLVLAASEVRPLDEHDLPHVRELRAA